MFWWLPKKTQIFHLACSKGLKVIYKAFFLHTSMDCKRQKNKQLFIKKYYYEKADYKWNDRAEKIDELLMMCRLLMMASAFFYK